MGIAERKQREREQRRNEILDSAEKVFFSKGFETATMDQVAEEAELSKGTLYLYFQSKDELYMGIFNRAQKLLLGMFLDAISKGKNGMEQVFNIGFAHYKYMSEYEDYFNASMHFQNVSLNLEPENQLMAECQMIGFQTLNAVKTAVTNGVKDGSIRKELDPMVTAFLLSGMSSGVFKMASVMKHKLGEMAGLSLDEFYDRFVEVVYHALKPGG